MKRSASRSSGSARRGSHGTRPGWACLARPIVFAASLLAAVGAPMTVAVAQGTLSAIEADVDQIARHGRPSMITIVAQREVVTRLPGGATQTNRTHSRMGSGVAVGVDEILTTASVVLGANRILVRTDNGLEVEAVLVGMDPIFNIALLRAPRLQLPAVKFASRPSQMGDWVIVLGSSYRALPTQSVGNIAYRFREPRMNLLQLTNEVYPGNSGGAALNSRGELVGLVQGELGTPEAPGNRRRAERRPSGMSFVIPSEDIVPVYRSLHRDGRVHLGYLGVSTRPAFVDSESEPGTRVPIGALVESVQAGGPADLVGLRKGDLIVAFEGEKVEYPEQLARWVAAAPPSTRVPLVWVHNDMQRTGTATLTESPSTIPSWMKVEAVEPVAAAPSDASDRTADIQNQIRRLNRELDRLRRQPDTTR